MMTTTYLRCASLNHEAQEGQVNEQEVNEQSDSESSYFDFDEHEYDNHDMETGYVEPSFSMSLTITPSQYQYDFCKKVTQTQEKGIEQEHSFEEFILDAAAAKILQEFFQDHVSLTSDEKKRKFEEDNEGQEEEEEEEEGGNVQIPSSPSSFFYTPRTNFISNTKRRRFFWNCFLNYMNQIIRS